MAEKVFYSFHYKRDSHRVSQVEYMRVVEGQPILSLSDWEEVEKGGDPAIKRYIDDEMKGRVCLVVLLGKESAGRRWVNYEIDQAWSMGMGVVAVRIHNLKNLFGDQDTKGGDPFATHMLCDGERRLSSYATIFNPPYTASSYVSMYIERNLATWVKTAVELRAEFKC